jgi:hypothetical protein
MTDAIERALQQFDAGALELLWALFDVPATAAATAAVAMDLGAVVAVARAQVKMFRNRAPSQNRCTCTVCRRRACTVGYPSVLALSGSVQVQAPLVQAVPPGV